MMNHMPNRHLKMSECNKLQTACRTGAVKIGENDADFLNFAGILDSTPTIYQTPKTHRHTPYNIKGLLNLTYKLIPEIH